MLFNSLHFYVFCIIVLPLFFSLKETGQKRLLLISSFYFYASLKLAFVPLLLFSFLVTFFGTLKITTSPYRKFWLNLVVLINIGILILFKYTDFLRSIYFDLESILGIQNEYAKIGFILPLGISFYTFQSIAYTVDVYRKQLEVETDFWNFSLFLIFFPQLVAGPIMRASVLIPQFLGQKKFTRENLSIGLGQIALGIFKKTMIADPISSFIDPIFKNPTQFTYLTCLLAIFFFAIQIYCDFAGYSDIAIGIGKILGFQIPTNFKRPFLSASSTELWRRWHISLSTWLRDYIYISLGGNRVSVFQGYINLFITMVIGGVWHGAAWTFAIWGFLCGFSVSIEKYFTDKGFSIYFEKIPKPIRILYTFSIFMLGALFFRSESFALSLVMLKKILYLNSEGATSFSFQLFIPVLILFLIELAEELKIDFRIKESKFYKQVRLPIILSVIIIAGFIYTVTTSPQFYYFQF
jgi:alginate O-acetyltransferase complex protein AlgI